MKGMRAWGINISEKMLELS